MDNYIVGISDKLICNYMQMIKYEGARLIRILPDVSLRSDKNQQDESFKGNAGNHTCLTNSLGHGERYSTIKLDKHLLPTNHVFIVIVVIVVIVLPL